MVASNKVLWLRLTPKKIFMLSITFKEEEMLLRNTL